MIYLSAAIYSRFKFSAKYMKFYYYAAWFNSTHQLLVTKKHGQLGDLKGKYNNSFSAFPSR